MAPAIFGCEHINVRSRWLSTSCTTEKSVDGPRVRVTIGVLRCIGVYRVYHRVYRVYHRVYCVYRVYGEYGVYRVLPCIRCIRCIPCSTGSRTRAGPHTRIQLGEEASASIRICLETLIHNPTHGPQPSSASRAVPYKGAISAWAWAMQGMTQRGE